MKRKDLKLFTKNRLYINNGKKCFEVRNGYLNKKEMKFKRKGVFLKINSKYYVDLNKRKICDSYGFFVKEIPFFPSRERLVLYFRETKSELFNLYIKYLSLYIGVSVYIDDKYVYEFKRVEKKIRNKGISFETYLGFVFNNTKNYFPNPKEILNDYKYIEKGEFFDVEDEWLKGMEDTELQDFFNEKSNLFLWLFDDRVYKYFFLGKLPKSYYNWFEKNDYETWNSLIACIYILDRNPFLRDLLRRRLNV